MSDVQEQHRNAAAIVEELNNLVEALENYPDTEVREKTLDLVQMILALHKEAFHHVITTLDSLPQREEILSRITEDEVTRTILLIHGLLPNDLQTRVASALEELRPFLISQGCDVKLLAVQNGTARMRLIRHGQGARAISTFKLEIEKALIQSVPELLGIEIEGASEPAKLFQIRKEVAEEKEKENWISVIRSLTFAEGELKFIQHADIDLFVCKMGGKFYAFRNSCAVNPQPLNDAKFENPMLLCACHGYHYDLRNQGVCLERPDIKLEALPVRVEDDKVKVAL